ncbi:unnamed protein product [Blepharisma stoltei]|uniref:Coiled-coil domain-containing protein 86 n=1 Tax=Blepharisma stoltei TaxID=1481888 RepID=A0AAU9ILB0_9CILI|nr:unnamed protein product [Blepharisma stoltei]
MRFKVFFIINKNCFHSLKWIKFDLIIKANFIINMVKNIPGKPKSGKPWKTNSKKSTKLDEEHKAALPKVTFEERMKKKQELEEVKKLEKSLMEERANKLKQAREKSETKKKNKEINQFKSSSFQVIKNTKKMKTMSKKLRSQIAKMPPGMFYKVIHGKNINN